MGVWLRAVLVMLPLLAVGLVGADTASAQDSNFLDEAACRVNPHSEECICREIHGFAVVPRFVDYTRYPPVATSLDCSVVDGRRVCQLPDPPRAHPQFNPDTLTWSGGNPALDYFFVENTKYKAYCSLAYFRENLRRLWVFALAFAGGLMAVTVAWAGVIYMQEAVSGETRSTARLILIRSVLGLVILAGVFLIWEGVSALFLQGYDIWRTEPGFLEIF